MKIVGFAQSRIGINNLIIRNFPYPAIFESALMRLELGD